MASSQSHGGGDRGASCGPVSTPRVDHSHRYEDTPQRVTEEAARSEEAINNEYALAQSRRGYDLLYFINTTPLRTAFMNNGGGQGRDAQADNNGHNVIIIMLMYIHLAMVLLISALMIGMVIGYKRPYDDMFSRPSEVLIFFWLMRDLVKTAMSAWTIRYQCMRVLEPRWLFYSKRVYRILTWVWLGFAVYFLILRPSENLHSTSCKIAFLLMWLTFAWNISPILAYAMLSIMLYPILSLIVRYRTQGGLTPGLPKKLFQKLEVERFDKVLSRINRGETKLYHQYSKGTARTNSQNSITVSITRDDGEESDKHKGTNANSSESPNAMLALDYVCAICILEIGNSEKIFVMPCDMRHFFHRDCLKTWFKRSRMCPICRVNIGDALCMEDKRQ
ncbi:hypothetical protein BgAZ_207060 [Babesia gibsoni]|uniref:RING-type domain-containing protein n=1 Tax=Babesia gibsoni TaxID=33632 RepID=A0AAD8UQN3_BABGI|nr:hypothetical protein BgAZ_207060 [Babesia gibsoni]